tara:strand:+ start:2390 stop:2767 length:378 start_codon:yes stop_codon:yes gene_type:complete
MKTFKDTYWHNLARVMIEHGFKPAQINKVIHSVFPETEVNGRHIGAFKRRVSDKENIEIPAKATISVNEAISMAPGLVSIEDIFIYRCSVGSTKRSLKCFEYKLTEEDRDELEVIEAWVSGINQK